MQYLAAHLCGSIAREPKHAALAVALGPFSRAQINGYTLGTADDWKTAIDGTRCRLILQAREEASLQLVATEAARIGADVLFDPSGGQGIEPFRWPAAPVGVRVGFAGGIKPENVEDVVAAILNRATEFMADQGLLLIEIGHERHHFEAAFAHLDPVWLDTATAQDQILLLTREQLLS